MTTPFPQPDLKRSSLLAIPGALLLSAGLFLVIPFTQTIQNVPEEVLRHREMVVMPPPPEPPVIEEETPPREVAEPIAEFRKEPPALELSQLEVTLNPGLGDALSMGVQSMGFDVELDAVAAIQEVFDFDDLAQPPNLINARQIRLKFPPELTRRGVKEVKVVVQILIDESGRTRPEKVVSSTYDDPRVEQEALRAVRQARFTVTRIDGKPVQVRARFPLTMRSSR